MPMKYCDHWTRFRENLRGSSVRYRLTMLYWYWGLSDVACQDCSFTTTCQRIMDYLRELEKAKRITMPENFKFELHWDQRITERTTLDQIVSLS